jgi:hypothetical protein
LEAGAEANGRFNDARAARKPSRRADEQARETQERYR